VKISEARLRARLKFFVRSWQPMTPKKKAVVEIEDQTTISGTRAALMPVDMEKVREEIAQLVGNSALNMVRSTIEHVQGGKYAAMKFLFQIVGLYPAPKKQEDDSEDTIAKLLLERLGLSEETPSERDYQGFGQEALSDNPHAVE
jgi:hypothetical protein